MRECYVDVRKRSLNSPTGRSGEQLRGGGLLGLSADRPSVWGGLCVKGSALETQCGVIARSVLGTASGAGVLREACHHPVIQQWECAQGSKQKPEEDWKLSPLLGDRGS